MGMYKSHPATNNKKHELINWPGAGDMWDLAKAQKVCLQHEARSKAFMVEVEVTISSFVKDTSQVDTCLLKNVWSCHYLRSYETWKCQVHMLSEVLRDMVGFETTGLLRRTQLFEFTCWCLFLVLVCSRSNRCIGTRCIRVFKHSTFLKFSYLAKLDPEISWNEMSSTFFPLMTCRGLHVDCSSMAWGFCVSKCRAWCHCTSATAAPREL